MPVRTAFFLASQPHTTATDEPVPMAGASCPKEGRLAAQGDSLLHDLIQHEQKQHERVLGARSEADAIVAAAEREAVELVARAQRAADEAASAALDAARGEAETATAKAVGDAEQAAQRLRSAADAQRERAVQRVLEQVLP